MALLWGGWKGDGSKIRQISLSSLLLTSTKKLSSLKKEKRSFSGPVSAEVIQAGNYNSVIIWQYLGESHSGDPWVGVVFELQLMNLKQERKKKKLHIWAGYLLTQRKVGSWLFSLLASSAGHIREIKIKTLHNWKKLCHPEIDLLLIWHLFPPPTFVRGPSTTRQAFEIVINFPEQSRVACRIPKILIWACLKRDWRGWGLSS